MITYSVDNRSNLYIYPRPRATETGGRSIASEHIGTFGVATINSTLSNMYEATDRVVELRPELDTALSFMDVDGPMQLQDPHLGFTGYLLRCKALKEEAGSDSVLLWAPGDKEIKARPLSDTLSQRRDMMSQWNKRLDKNGPFYGFLVEALNADDYDTITEAFETGGLTLMEDFAHCVLLYIAKRYPRLHPVAVVCHLHQITRIEDGTIWYRPVHFHLLMGKDV